jgi:hypothetical protein
MTTDLTMLKASLEASQAALQAASYALNSVNAAVSALLLQSQVPAVVAAPMQILRKETETLPVAPAAIAACEMPEAVEQEPEDVDPLLAPLSPEERKGINAQLAQLTAPQLKGFTAAFREAFDVPPAVKLIKGEITQQRHGVWILNFLESLTDGDDQ